MFGTNVTSFEFISRKQNKLKNIELGKINLLKVAINLAETLKLQVNKTFRRRQLMNHRSNNWLISKHKNDKSKNKSMTSDVKNVKSILNTFLFLFVLPNITNSAFLSSCIQFPFIVVHRFSKANVFFSLEIISRNFF